MTEQTIQDVRNRFLAAAHEAAAAMDFALAVFNPKNIYGQEIELDNPEKHEAAATQRLEAALANLRKEQATYESSRVSGGGMTRVITPAPLD